MNVSIVTFENNELILKQAIDSVLLCPEAHLIVVDNSITDKMKIFFDGLANPRIEFINLPNNVGFGSGHNVAIRLSIARGIPYHVVVNPDVYFDSGVLEHLVRFMDEHPDVALVMPKILDPEGQIQYLCKRNPTPFDLFARRFLPEFIKHRLKSRLDRFEMRERDYNKQMDAAYLSGCFMFLRTSATQDVGLFDERYFMYLEDADLCRKLSLRFRNVYCPDVAIHHHHAKGSYKNRRLLQYHIRSAIKYFNKWGWWPLC